MWSWAVRLTASTANQRFPGGLQGQNQGHRRAGEGDEAVMPIESLRLVVLSVHHERIDGHLGSSRTVYGIPQQGAAEFEALIGKRNG